MTSFSLLTLGYQEALSTSESRRVRPYACLPALDVDLIDDLQTILVVPLFSDPDEAVLRCQLVGGDVVRTDAHPRRAHLRVTSSPLEQRLQCRTGIAASPVGRVDRVADLHHPRRIGWPVVAGMADSYLLSFTPDDAIDPSRAGRVLLDLLGPH